MIITPELDWLLSKLSDRIFEAKFYAAYCASIITPVWLVVAVV